MVNELIELIKVQCEDLKELQKLLESQYKMIMDKDVFGLEGMVDKISLCSKRIAQEEVQRRNLLGNESITQIVLDANNKELENAYNNIKITLNEVNLQKDTNDMLLKQELMFNNKVLNIINPNRDIKTYNSYGNLSR